MVEKLGEDTDPCDGPEKHNTARETRWAILGQDRSPRIQPKVECPAHPPQITYNFHLPIRESCAGRGLLQAFEISFRCCGLSCYRPREDKSLDSKDCCEESLLHVPPTGGSLIF